MSKKKAEKLSPIPSPGKRRKPPAQTDRDGSGFSAVPDATQCAVDLTHIAVDLQPLAVPVAGLDFLPGNPRKHGERDLARLRASLKHFKQHKNIVVNMAKTPPQVIAGNGTLQAALALGWSHIAVSRVHMTDREAAAYAVSDNETALSSSWDDKALAAMLESLQDDAGMQSEDGGELDAMLEALSKAELPEPATDPEPETPATEPEKKAEMACPNCGHTWQAA